MLEDEEVRDTWDGILVPERLIVVMQTLRFHLVKLFELDHARLRISQFILALKIVDYNLDRFGPIPFGKEARVVVHVAENQSPEQSGALFGVLSHKAPEQVLVSCLRDADVCIRLLACSSNATDDPLQLRVDDSTPERPLMELPQLLFAFWNMEGALKLDMRERK